jgi:hypothetical protein
MNAFETGLDFKTKKVRNRQMPVGQDGGTEFRLR